ncbi:DNA-binding response regulator [Flavipsychrobacter stenotrophus]|uniref:DNA-binding response regulator n=1 Tax=Flavipsychrobacter stenotrophus TaxID=2077091 RepID=A0A2S7SZM6_9BACT|nr:response regulator transcription factor [Flavipsychrobacter stenotrophus]PQJ12382.1 DNA-binding response regulator [Flavipsychrobacter stenotrophus]
MNHDLDIRVAIIEDDETIREGYAFLIGNTTGYKIVGTYPSFEEAAKKIVSDDPDVVLLDVELPGISGIDALPKLKKLLPETHILILTVYEQEMLIFRSLGNGASGYLTKNTQPEKIVAAIKEVTEGGGPMSANIARMVISSFKRNESTPLTRRETEILEQIATGKSRKRIADELFIDLETVKSHIKNIYYKLDVHSKADAIKAAKDNKFI